MELVYLWVEEYKNIKKQGFNFSPRFKCKYDENSNELTIEEKDYVHIFPDNINVTAIVGENGSGKSSILITLIGLLFQNASNWRKFKKMILVINNTDRNIVYTFSGEKNDKNEFITFNIKNQEYHNLYDDNSCNPNNVLSQNFFLLIDFSLGQQSIWNDSENYKKNYALEPSRVYRSTGGAGITTKIEPSSFDSAMKSNAIFFYYYIFKYNLDDFLTKFKLPKFIYLEYNKASGKGKKIKEETFKQIKELSTFNINFNQAENWTEINEYIKDSFSIKKDITTNITEDDLYDLDKFFIYSDFEMKTEDGRDFSQLSTGQQLLISYIGIILRNHLKNKEKKNTLNILIDEMETSLHPNWQKLFLVFVIEFFKESKIKDSYNHINLVTSTHSPFILSDIPKENIIFLKKGKQIYPFTENEQTFGANIHTLLSHGFFMKDGLMGEFAKEKINNVIKLLNNDKKELSQDEIKFCKKIVSIIGEPILQRTLQSQLDMKLYPKESELEKLEREQKELQEKIDELKKKKNETD